MRQLLITISLAFCLIALTLFLLWQQSPAGAAPNPARVEVITLNSSAIAATTVWTGGRWSALGSENPPTIVEVYWFIDVGTVNTTTLTLQVSPDNSTWVNHSTSSALVSNVVADTNAYTRATIEGLYYRVTATAQNTQTITPVIKILLR